MTIRGHTLGTALLALALVLGTAGVSAAQADTGTQRFQTADGAALLQRGGGTGSVEPAASAFNVLQMNLCNGGGNLTCYENGLAVKDAVNLIRFLRPNVVTLNEICEDDVHDDLYPAFRLAWQDTPSHWTYWSLAYVKQPDGSGRHKLCENKQPYVVAVIGHVPGNEYAGLKFDYHTYPEALQHPDDNEWRAWACAAALQVYYACTTHLTSRAGSGVPGVPGSKAMDQCHELMDRIVPAWAWRNGAALPFVVGGDLNLRYGGSPDVQDCVPSGWYRKGDGDLQHIMATNDLTFVTSHRLEMCVDGREPRCSTDHPAWLVALNRP